MRNRVLVRAVASVGASVGIICAGGSKPVAPPPPAPNSAEIRVFSEVAPPGGTVQVKFGLTNPQPIMTGGTGMPAYSLDGVSLWSALGDSAGVGYLTKDGQLYISAISPQSDLGTVTDYPFLTVTMNVPTTLKTGTVVPLTLTTAPNFVNGLGTIATTVKPGTLTIGGGFSIHNVKPGGGTYAAGTTIRVEGSGFASNAVLKTPTFKVNSYRVVSSTEIEFTLKSQTTLDAQPIQVISGGLTQTYYSYLRGIPTQSPSRSQLKNTDPIFQLLTHSLAAAAPAPAQVPGQYTAYALQNPNPGPAAITLTLTHADGSITTRLAVLNSGERLMDELGALFGGVNVAAGDRFSLVSTAPIQILGMKVDETAWTIVPFLPTF